MLFAVMDICSREYQSQRNTILSDDVTPFSSQLSSICRVFPRFFPLSLGLKQFGCRESATATQSLSVRHALSGSGFTSFGTLLLRPTAESTCELWSLRNTRVEAFSTDSLHAENTRSHSTACVVRQAVSLGCIFFLRLRNVAFYSSQNSSLISRHPALRGRGRLFSSLCNIVPLSQGGDIYCIDKSLTFNDAL
jgi:hypothetical protein